MADTHEKFNQQLNSTLEFAEQRRLESCLNIYHLQGTDKSLTSLAPE